MVWRTVHWKHIAQKLTSESRPAIYNQRFSVAYIQLQHVQEPYEPLNFYLKNTYIHCSDILCFNRMSGSSPLVNNKYCIKQKTLYNYKPQCTEHVVTEVCVNLWVVMQFDVWI